MMKKFFFFLITAFLLSSINPIGLAAQDYIPMNFEKGQWYVDIFEKGGYTERIQMFCKGDTVINGHVFSKLFQHRLMDNLSAGTAYYDDTIIAEYVGAIRNTENKQVIFWSSSPDTAEIIYDFNLSIGDTIYGVYGDYLKVKQIDSVEYCGVYHKEI